MPHFCGLSLTLLDQFRSAVELSEKNKKLNCGILKVRFRIKTYHQDLDFAGSKVLQPKEDVNSSNPNTENIGLEDLNLFAVLGKGNFGKVYALS